MPKLHNAFFRGALALSVVSTLVASTAFSEEKKYQEVSAKPAQFNPNTAVVLSSPAYTFAVEFEALYVQPSGSNLQYAVEAVPLPLASPNWKVYEINPDYHFGFDVGVSCVFQDANTNLKLNWERFQSSDTAAKQVATTDMIGPLFEIGPDADVYKKSDGKVTFDFNTASLLAGVFVDFGNRLHTNLLGGIGFSRIKQTLFSRYSNLDGQTVRTITVPSTFTGAGPQVGLDFACNLYKGFKLTGEFFGSLFVGTQKNQNDYSSLSPALPILGAVSPNNQSTTVSNSTQIIPGLESKLGLCYEVTFKDHYTFKIEAGYKAEIYINAIQSIDMGSEVINIPADPVSVGVFARTFDQTISNFGLAGPYASVVFGF